MSPDSARRAVLLGGALSLLASAARAQGWYSVTRDDGKPAQTMRLPVELLAGIDRLPGVYRIGARDADVTIYEFFDYNCPFCRVAAPELASIVADTPDLALVLVDNPILAQSSRDVAAIEWAVLKEAGAEKVADWHKAMFARPGQATIEKALSVAETLGLARAPLAGRAATSEASAAIAEHLALSAALGFTLTPTFVIGPAGLFGYPGRQSFERMVVALRRCGEIKCK